MRKLTVLVRPWPPVQLTPLAPPSPLAPLLALEGLGGLGLVERLQRKRGESKRRPRLVG